MRSKSLRKKRTKKITKNEVTELEITIRLMVLKRKDTPKRQGALNGKGGAKGARGTYKKKILRELIHY